MPLVSKICQDLVVLQVVDGLLPSFSIISWKGLLPIMIDIEFIFGCEFAGQFGMAVGSIFGITHRGLSWQNWPTMSFLLKIA